MDGSMPGLPDPHHLQKFTQVHVHCIGDAQFKKIIEALSNSLLSQKIEYLCFNKPIFSLCIPLEHSSP